MKTVFNFLDHIRQKEFPCIMGKALERVGLLKVVEFNDQEPLKELCFKVEQELFIFLESYRRNPKKLSSFVLSFKNSEKNFEEFESFFWKFLKELKLQDKRKYKHDQRVSSNPLDPKFSFSLQSEAFFILLLHPESPRMSRRTKPTIVFNPHEQFEKLRRSKKYLTVRNRIRKNDINLQGSVNPMLKDFGESSEVLQYTGRVYNKITDLKEFI